MLSIGWFSTGRGEGSRGLLQFVHERLLSEGIDARIEFVFSNRAPGEAAGSDEYFRLVREYDLPLITHSSAEFRRHRRGRFADRREEYDAGVLERLEGRRPDICVLAGYMLIAGSALCRSLPLLNLHPALPDGPIGTWQEVVWQLIEQRAIRTGAMTHLATEVVDRGPLVSYVNVAIDTDEFRTHWQELGGMDVEEIRENKGEEFELFRLIRAEQYRREPFLLLETLRALSLGQINLDVATPGGEVTITAERQGKEGSFPGLCLDQRIEEAMRREVGSG